MVCDGIKESDGLTRVTYANYFGTIDDIGRLLRNKTGVEWSFLGCFMDTCCYSTTENVDPFTLEYR